MNERIIVANCPVCFGTGWQPMKVGAEWVQWPCQTCIKKEQGAERAKDNGKPDGPHSVSGQ